MAYKELLPNEDWAILQSSIFSVFKMIAGADGKIDKKEKDAIEVIIKNSNKLNNSVTFSIRKNNPQKKFYAKLHLSWIIKSTPKTLFLLKNT